MYSNVVSIDSELSMMKIPKELLSHVAPDNPLYYGSIEFGTILKQY